ncbi:hypothetical protein Tco_0961922 [Tanacetum coccineum]
MLSTEVAYDALQDSSVVMKVRDFDVVKAMRKLEEKRFRGLAQPEHPILPMLLSSTPHPHPLIREVSQPAPRPKFPQKTAALAKYSAWTTDMTPRYKPSITRIPERDSYSYSQLEAVAGGNLSLKIAGHSRPAWTFP